MLPEIRTAIAVIVFAGGPHTSSRYDLLQKLLPEQDADAIFLSGAGFESSHVNHINHSAPVFTDPCRTTITSCFSLARRIRKRYPDGADLVVVTSNYHAARVAWLLGGMLPARYKLIFKTSRDMTWENVWSTRLSKRLLAGEIKSWIYCFPAGLILRPLPMSAILLLSFLPVRFGKHRRDKEQFK